MDMNIPDIEDSFVKTSSYPSVRERYYKCSYYNIGSSTSPDHCVLLHSNKICVVTLAGSHPILRDKKEIKQLNFQVSNKLDRLENRVFGKGKKGGQNIQPNSVLCCIECKDGSKYSIYGCICGKLIEINEQLVSNCNLILEKPLTDGYIAVILPSKKDFNSKNKIDFLNYEW